MQFRVFSNSCLKVTTSYSFTGGFVIIKNRTNKIVKDFYSNREDSTDIDVSKEKMRIVKAALDIMMEELRMFDRYPSKSVDYPTVMGKSVDTLLNGN